MYTQSFEHVVAWQKAHEYVLAIYRITRKYPKEEIFCLVNQMRRAAASITANFAEGYARIGHKEKLRFYNISQGSLEETRNFVILSKDLGYISSEEKETLSKQAAEVSRLLNAYCQGLINSKEDTQTT
ncbi:four helix bundle protein [Parabacteroides sp. PFB2-10]|uniref:four helix bundle protein n=1 Tax=Parabacteroides sp. PFB2-10 TaxID=1742405 RepID=UPI002473072C|nr:four helix bundle protein [Parabacteroides sp. PFB2-10]MDH6313412.1 four helix bundle protein [Parabacteroides sp. PFB2-10]